MSISPPPLSPLQKLAAKWRAIGLVAVAFSKLLRRCEDGRAHGAQAQAEQLYIAVRSAQVTLVQEVAETLEGHSPQSKADEDALVYLRGVMVYLLAIALVIEDIMGQGELLGAAVWQAARYRANTQPIALAAQVSGIPILDPG